MIAGLQVKMFPMFGEAPMKPRKRMRRSRWTRDRALTLLELGLLLGSLALLAMGSRYRVYPLSLSLAAAAVAMVHVVIVRRIRAQSPAERMLEDAPMLDFSHAVRTARSVEGLYQSLIGMVNTTFPSKAVSLFVRDDETG